jgi:hypothetical protein
MRPIDGAIAPRGMSFAGLVDHFGRQTHSLVATNMSRQHLGAELTCPAKLLAAAAIAPAPPLPHERHVANETGFEPHVWHVLARSDSLQTPRHSGMLEFVLGADALRIRDVELVCLYISRRCCNLSSKTSVERILAL